MRRRIAFYIVVLVACILEVDAQRSAWIGGLGVGYTIPSGEWSSVASNSLALQGGIQWRRYSNLWFGISGQFLTKGTTPVGQDSAALASASFFIEPEARWFVVPAKTTNFPIYLRLGGIVSHMPIDGVTGNANGLGISVGVGMLIYYPAPDTDVFLDGYVRWMAPNMIVRDEGRNIFMGLQGGVMLCFRL